MMACIWVFSEDAAAECPVDRVGAKPGGWNAFYGRSADAGFGFNSGIDCGGRRYGLCADRRQFLAGKVTHRQWLNFVQNIPRNFFS